jgi:hypothetical protein
MHQRCAVSGPDRAPDGSHARDSGHHVMDVIGVMVVLIPTVIGIQGSLAAGWFETRVVRGRIAWHDDRDDRSLAASRTVRPSPRLFRSRAARPRLNDKSGALCSSADAA